MNDSQRIKKVIKVTNHRSLSSFARSIGYERSETIRRIVIGENGISAKVARNIVNSFPSISYAWLLTGEGEMLLEQVAGELELQPENKKAQESDLSRALAIIESQNQSIERLSEAALSFARSLEKLVESKVDPAQLSKAG